MTDGSGNYLHVKIVTLNMTTLGLCNHKDIFNVHFCTDVSDIICGYVFWTCPLCHRTRWVRKQKFQKCIELFCVEKRRATKATLHRTWSPMGSYEYMTLLNLIKSLQLVQHELINEISYFDYDYSKTRRLCRIVASEIQMFFLALKKPDDHVVILSREPTSRAVGRELYRERMEKPPHQGNSDANTIILAMEGSLPELLREPENTSSFS